MLIPHVKNLPGSLERKHEAQVSETLGQDPIIFEPFRRDPASAHAGPLNRWTPARARARARGRECLLGENPRRMRMFALE